MLTSVFWNMEFGCCPWRACAVGMISKAWNQPVSCWARQTGNICMCAGPCNQHMDCEASANASRVEALLLSAFLFFFVFFVFFGGGVNRDTSVSRPRTHQHQVRKHAQTGTPSRSEKEADGSFSTEGDKQNQIYSVWTDGIIRSVSTHTCRRTQRRSHKKNKLIQTQLSCGYDWPKQQYEADSG